MRKAVLHERRDLRAEHGTQFARRAGQHDEQSGRGTEFSGGNFHDQARCGAVGVHQDERVTRHLRLDLGALRHGAFPRSEEVGDAPEHLVIPDQFHAKQGGDKVARAVVAGGSESTGDDDQISAGQGFAHRFLDRRGFVRNGGLTGHGVAKIGELAAEPLLVGVEHAAQHQLAAGVDDFNLHAAGVLQFVRRGKGESGKLQRLRRSSHLSLGLEAQLATSRINVMALLAAQCGGHALFLQQG